MNSENMTPHTNPRASDPGLSQLHQVKLSDQDEAYLQSLAPQFCGQPLWRAYKAKMTRELLALAQITDRLKYFWFDVSGDFRVLLHMRVTVPCLPDPHGPLQVADHAIIGLNYREEHMTEAQPGYVFISIVRPSAVWLANVAPDFGQPLCLGPKLERAYPVKELIVNTYLALTLNSFQFSETDPAGILNRDAAIWWQHNTKLIPLSREPFITKSPLPNNDIKP